MIFLLYAVVFPFFHTQIPLLKKWDSNTDREWSKVYLIFTDLKPPQYIILTAFAHSSMSGLVR